MNRRRAFSALVALFLIVGGSSLWRTRSNFNELSHVKRDLTLMPLRIASTGVSDLSAICQMAQNPDGWVVFAASLNLKSDDIPRRYLQTAEDPFGLFIEYDPADSGLLRLGLGLGPERWNSDLPIRTVHEDTRETIIVAVSRDETRLITNVVDRSVQWPGDFVDDWRCDQVSLGSPDMERDTVLYCESCRSKLYFASGVGLAKMNAVLDRTVNIPRFHVTSTAGSVMVLAGFALMTYATRRRR